MLFTAVLDIGISKIGSISRYGSMFPMISHSMFRRNELLKLIGCYSSPFGATRFRYCLHVWWPWTLDTGDVTVQPIQVPQCMNFDVLELAGQGAITAKPVGKLTCLAKESGSSLGSRNVAHVLFDFNLGIPTGYGSLCDVLLQPHNVPPHRCQLGPQFLHLLCPPASDCQRLSSHFKRSVLLEFNL
jgi:hypothetical protein